MKICHMMTRFVRGGATNYIEDLIKSISGKHSLVCGPNSDPEYITEIRKLEVKVKIEKFLLRNNPIALLFSIITLYFFFRKQKFDIIHTNSTPAGFSGRIAGKLAGSKVVHTAHAVPFEKRSFIVVWAEKIAARFCDVIIDVSPKIKEMYVKKKIGKGKHAVIPVGIDIKIKFLFSIFN